MSFAEIAALTLHEVKNRLAQLAGRAEAAGDVETMRDTVAAADALTRLLVYYRAEIGSLGLNIDAHAPADLAAELLAGQTAGDACHVELDCSRAPTLWFYDEALVRMVLANAVQNAGRYARTQVRIEVAEGDEGLEFLVRDDGPGYPVAVLDDPSGVATGVSRDGTGLGLRLGRRIAEMHENAGQRGQIRLANQGGAVFRLILPG